VKQTGYVTAAATVYEKIWNAHVIDKLADGTCLLAVDRELMYEGSSHPAFAAMRAAGRPVRRPASILAMPDHLVPTRNRDSLHDAQTVRFMKNLRENCEAHGITHFGIDDARHGIIHVVGPEQGFTLPGLVITCPDSHTSTHGALGALAFGIGTSELEHVLSTQTIMQRQSRTMRVVLTGSRPRGIVGKDLALAVLRKIGAGGAVGHALEFSGQAISELSVEGRLTLCNMGVEAGARSAIVAPDDLTFAYIKGRPMAPQGELWEEAVAYWRTLHSDPQARFDREVTIDITQLAPQVTWGTSPDQVIAVDGHIPDVSDAPDEATAANWQRALQYMGLESRTAIQDVRIDRVFIGSCTNSRVEDLRAAAAIVAGRKIAPGIHGMVVPGSATVKRAAEQEGLDKIFQDAGFEWRSAGCSMCFGSVHDKVAAGQRCASTSNRNFEHRQGPSARTHLVSPASAAAAGIAGHFADSRELG
jgi:3-isopropylmalate/(R)-2-methylmalate dehydratase large subunit